MDAPGVGLEATEAGKHQDSEEESQHGQAQSGVCDQGKCFQIPLQLLLMRKGGKGWRGEIRGIIGVIRFRWELMKRREDRWGVVAEKENGKAEEW